jgi:restriction endonuclease Mrr
MPTVHLTIQQLQEAIENLTVEEFRQLNEVLDKRRRDRLTEIIHKARRNAAGVNAEEAERIIQEAIAEVRAEHADNRCA